MPESPRGQVLIIVSLAMVVLIGSGAFAVDLGRQAAEDRYIQNAADAAALAGCRALKAGDADSAAAAAAFSVAQVNLGGSPTGAAHTLPDPATGAPIYESGHSGDPSFLDAGILVSGGTVRVAIRAVVETSLGRVLGINELGARGRARCILEDAHAIPIIARRYANPPGPGNGFVDHMATEGTSQTGSVDPTSVLGYNGRTPASAGAPGPSFALFGPDAKASNDSQFRGFIALDIRNFRDAFSRRYYNGVPAGSKANSIATTCGSGCNGQDDYFLKPYPGPGFPPVISPADVDDQVAVIDGNKSAQVPSEFDAKYNVGDKVLLGLYNGTVMEIPDFTISMSAPIDVAATGTVTTGPTLTVGRHTGFNETVDLTLLGDTSAADPAHNIVDPVATAPAAGKMNIPTFTPDNFLPDAQRGTDVTLGNIETNAVAAGVYTAWVQGTSSGYGSVRRIPVSVRVGGAQPDFAVTVGTGDAANVGDTAEVPIYVTTAPSGTTKWDGGTVALSVDAASLPAGLSPASISFDASSVTPRTNTSSRSATMFINTAGLTPNSYTIDLRVQGTSAAGRPVIHLQPVTFSVATVAGGGRYVDIIGFGGFEILAIGSNYITARAISPVYDRPDHDGLRQFLTPRLVAWCHDLPLSSCTEN